MIPEALKGLNQWVTAINGSKQPYQALADAPASVSKPNTWSAYRAAEKAVKEGRRDQVGFVFNDNGIVGIDIDDGWDDEGFMTLKAADIIGECRSYTEYSRSGRGFHILLYGSLPFKGRNNRDGVEIYRTGRYFILTGQTMLFEDMVENQAAIDYVVERYFPETRDSGEGAVGSRVYTPVWPPADFPQITLQPEYPPIPKGCRNISLCSLAGQMKTVGYKPLQILNELRKANKEACKPPLDDRELRQIVESVNRYAR